MIKIRLECSLDELNKTKLSIFDSLQVPVSQESDCTIIPSASSDDVPQNQVSKEEISSLIEQKVAETLKRTLPDLLRSAIMTSNPNNSPNAVNEEEPIAKRSKVDDVNAPSLPATSSRADKYYAPVQEATISEELTAFLRSAFTKQLSKEVWTNVMEQYPDIKGTAEFLVSPVMQTGMKDDIKRVHGVTRTKDLFSFDDGLADKQAPFISAVRPLICALQSLETVGGEDDDDEEIRGPDPDHIKALIEDAIVLLGNAHCRLNSWCQKRFAEFLTDVGKRTMKDQIPVDKHLFPDQQLLTVVCHSRIS